MIKLGLVDDHEITRKGIKTLIELTPDIKVVLEASNGNELQEKLTRSTLSDIPHMIILDISMPGMNGFDTVQWLQEKYPVVKIIIFSLILEEDTIINMIKAGACAYITKNTDPALLADAVITVHNTGFYFSEQVKREYFRKYASVKKKGGFDGKQHITPKEIQFIRFSATNMSYREIADSMGLSPKTIENYRDSLFQKLDINNRSALVIYGVKNGLIDFF